MTRRFPSALVDLCFPFVTIHRVRSEAGIHVVLEGD